MINDDVRLGLDVSNKGIVAENSKGYKLIATDSTLIELGAYETDITEEEYRYALENGAYKVVKPYNVSTGSITMAIEEEVGEMDIVPIVNIEKATPDSFKEKLGVYKITETNVQLKRTKGKKNEEAEKQPVLAGQAMAEGVRKAPYAVEVGIITADLIRKLQRISEFSSMNVRISVSKYTDNTTQAVIKVVVRKRDRLKAGSKCERTLMDRVSEVGTLKQQVDMVYEQVAKSYNKSDGTLKVVEVILGTNDVLRVTQWSDPE